MAHPPSCGSVAGNDPPELAFPEKRLKHSFLLVVAHSLVFLAFLHTDEFSLIKLQRNDIFQQTVSVLTRRWETASGLLRLTHLSTRLAGGVAEAASAP